jgi:vesicle transport protein SEC22
MHFTHSLYTCDSDPVIQRKQRDFKDSNTPQQQYKSQLNEDLSEIHNIMKKNIDEILNRGEKLEHVGNISNELRAKSKDFKWGAKKLTWQARMQQYGPLVLIAVIVMAVLYFKLKGMLF